MALTARERQQRRRKKIKDNPEHDAQEKEKDKIRKQKIKKGMSPKELAAFRKHKRDSQRLYRANKAAQNRKEMANTSTAVTIPTTPTKSPYKTPQSFGKAVQRARKGLPFSPSKRKKIVVKLAQDEGVSTERLTKSSCSSRKLSQEATDQIINFFTRDDISWQSPNTKDIMKIKCTSALQNPILISKRFLVMTLKEAYGMFNEDNPDVVKFSKFCQLRPPHVFTRDNLPHNVCLCKYHENVRLLFPGLNIPEDFKQFTSSITCDPDNYNCVSGTCVECKDLFSEKYEVTDDSSTELISWYQWINTDKVKCTGTIQDCYNCMSDQLRPFLKHSLIKHMQSQAFENAKKSATKSTPVIQLDFAENYSCLNQNEIQSAHWANTQVTIFTAYMWYGKEKREGKGFIYTTDYLNHDKYAVSAFLHLLIKYGIENYPEMESITFFSDGAASQFKQRFNLANLTTMKDTYDLKNIVWLFFATSHGKGVVDGLGGRVKSIVRMECLSGANVNNAVTFTEVAKRKCPNIRVEFVDASDIVKCQKRLDTMWESTVALPNTQSCHYVRVIRPYVVAHSEYAQAEHSDIHSFQPKEVPVIGDDHLNIQQRMDEGAIAKENKDVEVGNFVLVRFAGKKAFHNYVGQIAKCDEGSYEVNFLKKFDKQGQVFVFPDNCDCSWIEISDIITKLPQPEEVSEHRINRVAKIQFHFSQFIDAE